MIGELIEFRRSGGGFFVLKNKSVDAQGTREAGRKSRSAPNDSAIRAGSEVILATFTWAEMGGDSMATQSLPPAARKQGDAICFTSGPSGAAFSAGVIHAWLAADREAPLIAAGVSMGSVSAAALEFCYRELNNARIPGAGHALIEQKRWEWYRRYLSAVTENPLKPIWESIPDPVDFHSTGPPVRDMSAPLPLVEQEAQARRHYHILTKLGIWLAGIPVRVSNIATIAVMFVRRKEG
jgi:hypothetical protein